MKRFFVFLACFAIYFMPLNAASIVFVHIGEAIPDHVRYAIDQAKLFNPRSSIYLLANSKAIENLAAKGQVPATVIACETIPFSQEHEKYVKKTLWRQPFWRYTSERFLYLYDFVKHYRLENVFHLENDVMLYADVDNLLPSLLDAYQGIAATFDNDERCIPGFVFIPNESSLKALAQCFVDTAKKRLNDMQVLAVLKNTQGPSVIDHLPIVPKEYASFFQLKSAFKHIAKEPGKYFQHVDALDSVFDAAALGQYLGGIDVKDAHLSVGFINESCVFDPSKMRYEWKEDEFGRRIPYMIFQGKKTRINNLHIHSKRLFLFSSKNTCL